MNDELKITKERVLSAAEKCGIAEEILKELFPEVFNVSPPEWEDITKKCRISNVGNSLYVHDGFYYCFLIPNGAEVVPGAGDVKVEHGLIWRKRGA